MSSPAKKSSKKKKDKGSSQRTQAEVVTDPFLYNEKAAPSLEQKVLILPSTPTSDSYRSQDGGAAVLQRYTRGRDLGLGAFSNVFAGKHKASGKEYAIKKIDREKMQQGRTPDRDALEDEVHNLIQVRHGPNIVQLYEVYEEPQHCFLVMELLHGGELFDRILDKKHFSEREARDCIRSILTGLEYLHEKNLAHRDLKPENLLLTSDNTDTDLKIADFGFSKLVQEPKECRTLCGTPGYMAPEILERWPAYDQQCDLWSVGVILFLLLGGYLPFDDEDDDKVFERTRNGQYFFHPAYWKLVSKPAKSLVTHCLTVNPNKRYTSQQALADDWMQVDLQHTDTQEHRGAAEAIKSNLQAAKQKQQETAPDTNRLEALQDNFTGFLDRQRQDSQVMRITPDGQAHRAQKKFVEEGNSGKYFDDVYEVGDLLGEGGYAQVYEGIHNKTGEIYAVKDVDTAVLEENSIIALKEEILILKLLRGGPHIIRLFDVFVEEENTYLIMEMCKGGDLLTRITDKEVYTEREARKLCKIIFQAMDYLHKMKICHRDIKPENVLMVEANDDTSIKIADFGFAKKVLKPNGLKTLCGTAQYVAPEVLDLQSGGYDTRADMWSVGVVVYILLGGYAPFEGPVQELARAICKADYVFHDKYWSDISDNAKGMISSLLEIDVEVRLSAEQALTCTWMIMEEEELIGNVLSGAQEVLAQKKKQEAEAAAEAAEAPAPAVKGAVVNKTNKLDSLDEVAGGIGTEEEFKARKNKRTSMAFGLISEDDDEEDDDGEDEDYDDDEEEADFAGGDQEGTDYGDYDDDEHDAEDYDDSHRDDSHRQDDSHHKDDKAQAKAESTKQKSSSKSGAKQNISKSKEKEKDKKKKKKGPVVIEDSTSGKPFDKLYKLGKIIAEEDDANAAFEDIANYESQHRQSKLTYCVKRIERNDLHPIDAVALQDEIACLRMCRDCPWIIDLVDVFEEPDYTFLVMERLKGGQLIDRVIERKYYTEFDARKLMNGVLEGVEFCHNRRICIRNLKAESLICVSRDSDTHVKISDFTLSKRVLYPNSLQTQCGTEGYVAPEILEHRPAYDVQCDIWSLGVTLYILLGGYRPFRGEGEQVMRLIRYGEFKFHKRYWRDVSEDAKILISRMLTVNPIGRITATAALGCDWFVDCSQEELLHQTNLTGNAQELKELQAGAKAKVKAAVNTIIFARKLESLGDQVLF